jgi:hypothetical protein
VFPNAIAHVGRATRSPAGRPRAQVEEPIAIQKARGLVLKPAHQSGERGNPGAAPGHRPARGFISTTVQSLDPRVIVENALRGSVVAVTRQFRQA